MDLVKCQVLLRAVDTGSFTKAAEELGYTPSGVTHMMNALEEELGITLLHRTRSGCSLTPSGKDLISSIREFVSAGEKVSQTVAQIQGLDVGHVTIGAGQSFARYLLPKVISRFQKKYPKISIELIESGGTQARQLMQERIIDIAVISRQEMVSGTFISLFYDDILAVVSEENPLAQKKEIDISELGQYPFIRLKAAFDHDVEMLMRERKFEPAVGLMSTDENTIMAMVKENLGVSIMAGMHVNNGPSGIVGIPFKPRALRETGLFLSSEGDLSPADRKFIEEIKLVVEESSRPGRAY